MKRFVEGAYLICLAVCTVLMIFAFATFRLEITGQETKEGFERITEYDYQLVADESAMQGVREEYAFRIAGVQSVYHALMFYTTHQNAEVYLDGELLYSMQAAKSNAFNRSPGCVWNEIILSSEDNDGWVRIVLEPVYAASIGNVPVLYFGVKYDIGKYIIMKNFPAILLSTGAVLLGLVFIIFILYNYRNSQLDRSLMMLGLFSVNIGIWKLSDMSAVKFLFSNAAALGIQPLVSLLLVTVPFTLFVKDLHRSKNSWIWYLPCVVSLIHIVTEVGLQISGKADFRQMLLATHLILCMAISIIVYMVIHEARTVGWNKKLKRNVLCVGSCCVGMTCDMLVYYFIDVEGTFLGILGFMVYIIVIGADSMREAKQLMDIGMRARSYEQMAYHDQLTGLYNRTAYAAYIGQEDFDPDHCIVIMIDLNDLKKCNDQLGHEKGDVYIRQCADILQEVFQGVGRCYRMGGDEFCVLVKGITMQQCKQMLKELRGKIEERNRSYPSIHMQVACGFEMYDKRIDYDIGDTSRRADKMMYQEKFQMKKEPEQA